MALESATYINQLVAANPTLVDPKGQGDDHLRMIKRVLQSTFPNFTGATTVTQDQLSAIADQTVLLKPNMVIMWGGTVASIPAGWLLCNGVGTTSLGLAVPDLRNRFVIGAGSSYTPGNTGGSTTHDHFLQINGTALTVAQIPAHSHTGVPWKTGSGSGYPGFDGTGDAYVAGSTDSTGSGAAHTHSGQTLPGTIVLPPYYALAYIIKN